jgi:hypothetical protein
MAQNTQGIMCLRDRSTPAVFCQRGVGFGDQLASLSEGSDDFGSRVRIVCHRVHVDPVGGLEFAGVAIASWIPVDLGLQDWLQIEKGLDLDVVEEGAS